MLELIQYPFMQRALLGFFFTAIICAVAGTIVVVNRSVFITGGVAHASYGGIGFAIWAGFPPLLGAMGVAVLMGAFMGRMQQRGSDKTDAMVSALWAIGMASGVLLMDLSPGYSIDYLSYLFGNVLLISDLDLGLIALFAALSVILAVKYYRIILSCSADPQYAATLGLPVARISLILTILLCVSVVMLMRVSGLIMVMALLSIPASIAETHTKRLSVMMALSGMIAGVSVFGGMWISTGLNLTPSATIVAILAAAYIGNILISHKNK